MTFARKPTASEWASVTRAHTQSATGGVVLAPRVTDVRRYDQLPPVGGLSEPNQLAPLRIRLFLTSSARSRRAGSCDFGERICAHEKSLRVCVERRLAATA